MGRRKSRLFFQDTASVNFFPATHLLCRGGRPAASLPVLGSPRLFLKNPYSWTEKPRACMSSCLIFPTCRKKSGDKETKKTESYAHQTRGSILALLELARADVDMGSNGPVKPGLLLAVGGVGKGGTALLTQPEQPYQRSAHCLIDSIMYNMLVCTWIALWTHRGQDQCH